MDEHALLTSFFNIASEKEWGKNKKYIGYYFFFNSPEELEKIMSAEFLAKLSGKSFVPVLVEYTSELLKEAPENVSPSFLSRSLKLIAEYGLEQFADFVVSSIRIFQRHFRDTAYFKEILSGVVSWSQENRNLPPSMISFLKEQIPNSPAEVQVALVKAFVWANLEKDLLKEEIFEFLKEEAKTIVLEKVLTSNPLKLNEFSLRFSELPDDEKRVTIVSELKSGRHSNFRKHFREYTQKSDEIEELLYAIYPVSSLMNYDDTRVVFSETPVESLSSVGKELFVSILESAIARNREILLNKIHSRFESSLHYSYVVSILSSPEDVLFEKIKKIPFYLERKKTMEQMITALRMGKEWAQSFLVHINKELKKVPFEIIEKELKESIACFLQILKASTPLREKMISKLSNADLKTIEVSLKLGVILELYDRLGVKPSLRRLEEARKIGEILNIHYVRKTTAVLTARFYPQQFYREMKDIFNEDPSLYSASITRTWDDNILKLHLNLLWSKLSSKAEDDVLEQLVDATIFLLNKLSPLSPDVITILKRFSQIPLIPDRLRREFLKHIIAYSPLDYALEFEKKLENEEDIKVLLAGLRIKIAMERLSKADLNYVLNTLIFGKYLSHENPSVRAEAFSLALASNEQRLFLWLSQQLESEEDPDIIKKYLWFLKGSKLFWESQRSPAFIVRALGCSDHETRALAESMTKEHPYSDTCDYGKYLEEFLLEQLNLNIGEVRETGQKIASAVTTQNATGRTADIVFHQKERFFKQITSVKELSVMFIDMKGFTSKTAGMSPVEVRELLETYESLTIPHIEANGGRVVKKIGDGIMAVFDEPIKALDAAHDILSSLFSYNLTRIPENQIHVRIGLNHGKVFVEKNDVFGDTVNLAARMESAAQPDSCYMTLPVYNAGKDKYELIPVGYLKVKGFKEEILAYMMVISSAEESQRKTLERARKLEKLYKKMESFEEEISRMLKGVGIEEHKIKRFHELWNDFLGKIQKEVLN